jgi:hypothetical protein
VKCYRVSNVEAYRQYEQDEDADAADLLARIRGDVPPSTAMLAGTAFHKALEHAQDDAETLEADGFTFRFVVPCEVALAPVREMRMSKTYIVDGEPAIITGQVDAIEGKRIDDHKTTGRFDADRYLSGYQWRLYLDIFGADHFRWNVFEIALNEDADCYDVHASHRLEQYRYPDLSADCQALVERFVRFMRQTEEVTA